MNRQIVHAFGHFPGEAMDRRFLSERGLEVSRCERDRIERPEPFAQPKRPQEGLLHGDLLVEREPDEQRHRVRGDQRVGLV